MKYKVPPGLKILFALNVALAIVGITTQKEVLTNLKGGKE